jgi:regulator of nucleoside diphosphate kinase
MRNERYLTQHDAASLSRLAEQLLRTREFSFNAAEKLIELISTSILLPQGADDSDYVTLNSRVDYRTIGSREVRSLTIVCPQNADAALAQVSILAPLALALIGRPRHSIVEVELPFRKLEFIEIVGINNTGHEADATAPVLTAELAVDGEHDRPAPSL